MNNNILRYKIVIAGDGNVGKTAFVNYHANNNTIFNNDYIPTLGVNVQPIIFNTNYGPIIFDVWDIAGDDNFGGMRYAYFQEATAVIIMYDLTNQTTFNTVDNWKTNIINIISNNIPIDIYGTKSDLVYLHNETTISVKNYVNLNVPFVNLARKLTGMDDLIIIPHISHQ